MLKARPLITCLPFACISGALCFAAKPTQSPLGSSQGKPTRKPANPSQKSDGRSNLKSPISNLQSNKPRPLLALQVGHTDIDAVAYSRDSRTLATGGGFRDRTIRLWDTHSGLLKATLLGHTDSIGVLSFSPDGKTLVSADRGTDRVVRLWDVNSAELRAVLAGHKYAVSEISFSPNQMTLAVMTRPVPNAVGEVRLWDLRTNQLKATLDGATAQLGFSPDGKTFATRDKDKAVRLWDAATGQLKAALEGTTALLGFSPDGKTFAARDKDNIVRLWDAETGQLKATLQNSGSSFAFSPDGELAATSGNDKAVRVWEVRTGTLKTTIAAQDELPWQLAFTGDGNTLVVGSSHKTIRMWDMVTGGYGLTLKDASSVLLSDDGETVATSSSDKTIRLLNSRTGQLKATLPSAGDPLAFSHDANSIAIFENKEIQIWDTVKIELRTRISYPGIRIPVTRGTRVFSADGRWLATVTYSEVQVWDTSNWQRAANLQINADYVAFSPNGHTLATARDSLNIHEVQLWDVETWRLKSKLQGAASPIAFSPDGTILATNSEAGSGRLWDTATWKVKVTLQGKGEGNVWSMTFSPDGKTVVAGHADGVVRFWEAGTGQLRMTVQTDRDPYPVTFSSDGKVLATGSFSGSGVRTFDVQTGQPLRVAPGRIGDWAPRGNTMAVERYVFTTRICDVATGQSKAVIQDMSSPYVISPDRKTIAAAVSDQTVLLLDAQSGQQRARLKPAVPPILFAPDSKTVETDDKDNTARVWDSANGQQLRTQQLRTQRKSKFTPDDKVLTTLGLAGLQIFFTRTSPDGRTVVTAHYFAGAGLAAVLWDAESGLPKARLTEPTAATASPITGTIWFGSSLSPDGKTLWSSRGPGSKVRVWDLESGELKATLPAGMNRPAFFQGSGSIELFADNTIGRVFDAATGQPKAILEGHTDVVVSLVLSHDGKTIATGSRDKTARLWDAETGKLKLTLAGHSGTVGEIAFSPDDRIIVTAVGFAGMPTGGEPSDSTARLWDTQTGREIAVVTVRNDGTSPMQFPIWKLVFSSDGRVIAIGGAMWKVAADKKGAFVGFTKLWEVKTGTLRATLEDDNGPVNSIVFSSNGKVLYTKTQSGKTARLWNVETGNLVGILQDVTTSAVFSSAVFSPDGKILATGSTSANGVRLWNTETGKLQATLDTQGSAGIGPFSRDSKLLVTRDGSNKPLLWDVATAKQIPMTTDRLDDFTGSLAARGSFAGPGDSVHDQRDGRILATIIPITDSQTQTEMARAIATGEDKPLVGDDEWFVSTPEGYFDCSANAAKFIKWNVNGELYAAERYLRRFKRPDLVRKALRGERITAPAISGDDIPPAVRFVKPLRGDVVQGDAINVAVEARDDRDVKDIELFVNGRPQKVRPIVTGAKPIAVGAKDLDPNHRIVKRFTMRVELPQGAEKIELRAVAYDDTDLGSEPAVIYIRRVGAKPIAGNLYVLSVGVSKYRNADGTRLKNLRFPVADAKAFADRFRREGPPLYESPANVRVLLDEQATLANTRAELKRIQQSVRPGGVDTVIVYLSGHGFSEDGKYFFATHDLDLKNVAATSFSGAELKEALGTALHARNVFLFVDTCHSGTLNGRSDDLFHQVKDSGAYLLASSGPAEYSFEDERWNHGAFTLALLKCLDRKDLEDEGAIRFSDLGNAVAREVRSLLRAAQRNETEQQVRMQATGPLLEPVARAVTAAPRK